MFINLNIFMRYLLLGLEAIRLFFYMLLQLGIALKYIKYLIANVQFCFVLHFNIIIIIKNYSYLY